MLRSPFAPVALLAILGLLGCDTPITSAELDTVPHALRVDVSVHPDTIVPGDTAHIEVRLTNPLPLPVKLHFSSSCQLLFKVENAEGERVHPRGGWGCLQTLTELNLDAGDTHTRQFTWTGARSLYPEEGREPFPAGEYRVVGMTAARSDLATDSSTLVLLPPQP